MKSSADIRLKSDSMEMAFEWRDFDGDDCFTDFHINVVAENEIRRFDFGPSVIYGLRKLRRFFRDANQKDAGLGFRYPDIRCCDLHRVEDGYSVSIRFEGSQLNKEFVVKHPNVEIDDEFLTDFYDA